MIIRGCFLLVYASPKMVSMWEPEANWKIWIQLFRLRYLNYQLLLWPSSFYQTFWVFWCLFCVYPTGLYEHYPTNAEPECCDVRWGLLSDHQSKGTIKTSGSTMCHRTSLTVSSASRLCNSRLKLCVLVLILLHTVLTVSAAQNSTGLGFGGITTLEDNSTNEEWKKGFILYDRNTRGPSDYSQIQKWLSALSSDIFFNDLLGKRKRMGHYPNKNTRTQLFID